MKVVLEPISGTPKANLERTKVEIERLLAFRGSVTSVKARGTRIMVEFEINPKWDLPMHEKVGYLQEWLTAKVRKMFKVVSVAVVD